MTILFSVAYSPNRACPHRSNFLDHIQLLDTHTHTHTHTRQIPVKKGSARRKDRYIHNKKQTQETNVAPSENRSRDPSNQAVSDLRIKTLGHWDRLCVKIKLILKFIATSSKFALSAEQQILSFQ